MINSQRKKPTIGLIKSAVHADAEAVNDIIQHYRPYIIKLCTIEIYNKYGLAYSYVDEYMCYCLELKLISVILDFKIK